MRTLYHYPLHPGCRAVRIAFAEKKLKLNLAIIDPWSPDPGFVQLTAEAMPPVLTDLTAAGPIAVAGTIPICEYADEGSSRNPLLPGARHERAEIRRLCAWFDGRFDHDAGGLVLAEKLGTTRLGGTPDMDTLKEGRAALSEHLDYMGWLLERRDGLAGPDFTLADIIAFAHLSCLDYLGEIPWRELERTRKPINEWYARIKSRPSVRPLLADRIPGLRPPAHYGNLDF